MSFSSASTKACKQLLLIVPQNTLLYSSLQTNVTFLFHFHSNHDLTFLRTKILFKYNLWFCPMFKCNLTMVSPHQTTDLHICIILYMLLVVFFFFLFLSFIHILNVGGSLVEITYGHTHSQYNLTLIINHFGQVIVQTSLDKERMKSAVMTCANRVE